MAPDATRLGAQSQHETTTGPGSAPPRALLLLTAVAGLSGAAGVALAAVAAHRIDSPALATAAMMLMVHAAAALAVAALALRMTHPWAWITAGALMLAAVGLFSGDIALHTMSGTHLFHYAAPIGGSATILSWLMVAALAGRDFVGGSGKGR